MRDAFGGAFMIRLFLIFIFIYMVFTAIALNYAKAFKVKNKVISYLEDNEIIDLRSMNAKQYETMESYFEYDVLGGLNYRVSDDEMTCDKSNPRLVYCENGIKIFQYTANYEQKNKLGTYYRVETQFTWNARFLRKLLEASNNSQGGKTANGTWTISGESRAIVKK